MSILELYEKRYNLDPLTIDEIAKKVEAADEILASDVRPEDLVDERLILWLSDRLQAAYDAMQTAKDIPTRHRCAWCWRAGPMTGAAWDALPTMTLDEAGDHTQKCEHNPLVQRNRMLEAEAEDLRGRALGIDDGLRDAIRALLRSEAPAGELRRALWELVR